MDTLLFKRNNFVNQILPRLAAWWNSSTPSEEQAAAATARDELRKTYFPITDMEFLPVGEGVNVYVMLDGISTEIPLSAKQRRYLGLNPRQEREYVTIRFGEATYNSIGRILPRYSKGVTIGKSVSLTRH